jgi:hypothetical protein
LSRSYAASLPSSLTRVLPSPWCAPPTYLCRFAVRAHRLHRLEAFLGPHARHFCPVGPPSRARLRPRIFLRPSSPRALGTSLHPEAGACGDVSPSLRQRGTGLFTCCPSPTPCGLGLGPTNPTRIDLPSETLGIRRMRFSRMLRYSCRHSHLPPLHAGFP